MRNFYLALCGVVIGVFAPLWCLLVLVYWIANPSLMFSGGRPVLAIVSTLIGGVGAWAGYLGSKRLRRYRWPDLPPAS